jgi:hypothetical protein
MWILQTEGQTYQRYNSEPHNNNNYNNRNSEKWRYIVRNGLLEKIPCKLYFTFKVESKVFVSQKNTIYGIFF